MSRHEQKTAQEGENGVKFTLRKITEEDDAWLRSVRSKLIYTGTQTHQTPEVEGFVYEMALLSLAEHVDVLVNINKLKKNTVIQKNANQTLQYHIHRL